jgi:hypothetical protein
MERRFARIAMCLAWLSVMAPASFAQQPATPQPTAEQLQPGLAVGYSTGYIQRLGEIVPPKAHDAPPLPKLDFVGEQYDKVLTSTYQEGVAADIVGFIKLDAPGIWKFQVNSNDGVRVDLGGKKILLDDFVHSDQMSDVAEVEVKEPGWYPLHVLFFQKKGTYALQLFWQKPGGGEQEIVPAEALAHAKP